MADQMAAPIAVITPLKMEWNVLSAALAHLAPAVQCLIGGHGKTQFALHTLDAIDRLTPRLVICAGTAGALASHVKPGDVVVAETTIEHDYNMKFVAKPQPSFEGDAEFLAHLRWLSGADDFTLHFGKMASGDEDVVEPSRAQELHTKTGALAVGWEGAGGARACRLRRVPYLEMRAISDSCNSQTLDDFNRHLARGMKNLARVIGRFSEELR